MKNFITKNFIWIATTIFVILAWATWATAGTLEDALSDPVVIAPQQPAAVDWAGPYGGVIIGAQKAKTRRQVDIRKTIGCGDDRWCDIPTPPVLIGTNEFDSLPDRTSGNCGGGTYSCVTARNSEGQATQLWLREPLSYVSGSRSESRSNTDITYGGFAGMRFDGPGPLVPGVEVSASYANDLLLTGEVQVGIGAGRVLTYVSGGVASYSGNTGYVAGAGIDFAVSRRVLIGVKAQYGNFGRTTTKTLLARIAYRF